jgi:hypothetical protein
MNMTLKKLIPRVGKSLLIITVSLAFLSLIRSSTTNKGTYLLSLDAGESQVKQYFLPPQDLRLEISSEVPITVSLSNPYSTRILQIENSTRDLQTIALDIRGTYALSVYNPTNKSTDIRLDLTFYGLEKDLIQTSIALGILGIIAIVAPEVFQKFERK